MPETDATPGRGGVGVGVGVGAMLPCDLPVRDVLPFARQAGQRSSSGVDPGGPQSAHSTRGR